jgi:phage terminase large subunit-like protein
VLDAARQMVLQDEKLQRYMGLEVAANKIVQARTGSRLWALSAKGTSSEGLAVNLAVLDELHAVRGRELYDSLAGACSKRVDSLFLTVTTAGDDSAGIAFEVRGFAERILAGEAEDDTFFSALYTIDPDDDWTLPTTWQKANPSWGVSVDPRAVAEEAKRAQQIPGARYNFRSRHLCEWVLNGGNDPFLDDRAIRRCFDPGLEESRFDGTPCALAADLASRIDMCAVARIHSRRLDSKIHHYAFLKCFLPTSQERASVAYAGWAERGELVFTSGKSTDQDAIENHIAAALSLHKVRDISFDPMQSNMLVSHLEKRRAGVTLEIAQSAKYLTPGVLELQEAVTDGRFHTNSQILIWALGNLRVRTVGSNMLQPARPADRTKKIDAAVAVIMALRSVALVPLDDVKPTPRILLMDNRPGGSIIDLTNQRRIVSSGGADAPACEPERPGMTLVRILGTGDLKWLPETAAALLIADGAAEKI